MPFSVPEDGMMSDEPTRRPSQVVGIVTDPNTGKSIIQTPDGPKEVVLPKIPEVLRRLTERQPEHRDKPK